MKHKPPTQRQLKVGELIRHALSTMFLRGEIPYLDSMSITVSEVQVSPDLKNAVAFIYPLGGKNADLLLKALPNFCRHNPQLHCQRNRHARRTADFI